MRTEDGARLTKLVADAMARLVGAPGSVYVGSHRPGLKIPLPRTMSASTIPLPQTEYESIYAKVPRLTVEVIVVSPDGVLLARRQTGPCAGLWHIPGGTVRFGEPLTNAVQRVADEELGVEVTIDGLLGYIEYPSHLQRGLDWPLGMAF